MPVYEDNTQSIGRTPLIRINRLNAGSGATILAKIEGRNPAYSVKCRTRRDGLTRTARTAGNADREATSGNTESRWRTPPARGYGCG